MGLLEELEKDLAEGSPLPWSEGSYAGVVSVPRMREYDALEEKIPLDAPDDDPRWKDLPEVFVAWVPTISGDLPTLQGAKDAKLFVRAVNSLPKLINAARSLKVLRDRIKHERARYEGDGDPGCTGSCMRCLIDDTLSELEPINSRKEDANGPCR